MRKTLRKCLARLLALTVVASMTCSYVFAADFGDLQDAVSGSTVDGKAPSEAVDVSDISRPAEPTDEKTEPADNTGANDATGGTETNSSSPEDGEPAGDTGSTGSDADNAGSSNKSGDGTGSTGDAGNTNSEGNEPAGGDGEEDNISGEDGNTNGEGGNTDNAGDNKSANSEDNQQGDKPVGEPKVEEPNKAPETKETKPDPKNGDIVETGEDGTVYYGYGWTKKEDGTWVYGITAYDKDSGEKDATTGNTIYDRHVQLNESVSYDSSKDSSSTITIGKTPSGGKIYLDLGGFNISGSGSSSVVKVDNGGNLTLKDDTGKGQITNGTTGVDIRNGSSFTMESGIISGNKTGSDGGGVYVGVGSTFNLKGGEISDNTVNDYSYLGKHYESAGGGVLVEGGTFNMSGGTIKNNSAIGGNGGGVAVKDYYDSGKPAGHSIFNMTGGTIEGNHADTGEYNKQNEPIGQGGGVYVGHGSEFNLNGGTISSNTAAEGGGIFVEGKDVPRYYDGTAQNWNIELPDGTFTMTGGIVDGNTASVGEGGGIYIQGKGTISKGSITNNKTYTANDLGGGGIYIENSGKLQLYNTIITENKAGGLGAGLAACVHGKTVIFLKDGAAIFSNHATVTESGSKFDKDGNPIETATSNGYNGNGTKIDGHDLWDKDGKMYDDFKAEAQDIFTASDGNLPSNDWSVEHFGKPGIIIGTKMLGGGDADWTGWMFTYDENGELETENGKVSCVQVKKDEAGNIVYADRLLGVQSHPDDATIRAAQAAAAAAGGGVLIQGNYSATHGGGIANNGLLIIGEEVFDVDNPDPDVTKTLTKDENAPENTPDRVLQDGEFTFVLTDENYKPITTVTNTADGNVSISFPEGYFLDKADGDYTFYITEVNNGAENIIYDNTQYKIVVTVEKKDISEELPDIGGFEKKGSEITVKMVISKSNGIDANGSIIWDELGENASMPFNNRYTSPRSGGGGDDDDDDDDEPRTPPPTPEDPTVEVPEEDVPLANLPEEPTEEVEIPEEDVPLAESPQTGDGSRTALWAALSGFSLLGMLGLMLGKKRDEL